MTSATTTDGEATLMLRLVSAGVLLPIHTHLHAHTQQSVKELGLIRLVLVCVEAAFCLCSPCQFGLYKASLLSLGASQPGNPVMPTKHLTVIPCFD